MKDSVRAKALASLRQEYNDLRIVAGADTVSSGLTLLAILRNEMYFLPGFLAHYRNLGVEKFVFLNDRSDDDTFEFLARQPDATVVESGWSYGDTFEIPDYLSRRIKRPRILYLWRALLHDMFAPDDWALQVDLDEFICLPEGTTFHDVVRRLEAEGARAAWGVMLDVYPQNFSALSEHEGTSTLDASAPWYFDGEQHLLLRRDRAPLMVYSGARTRLYTAFRVGREYSRFGARLRNQSALKAMRKWIGVKSRGSNAVHKSVLVKWTDENYYRNSHETNRPGSKNILLPILHYRFSGNLRRRLKVGLEEKSYHLGSADHRLLSELLQKMSERNGSFLYRNSRPVGSFGDFVETRNAFGL